MICKSDYFRLTVGITSNINVCVVKIHGLILICDISTKIVFCKVTIVCKHLKLRKDYCNKFNIHGFFRKYAVLKFHLKD